MDEGRRRFLVIRSTSISIGAGLFLAVVALAMAQDAQQSPGATPNRCYVMTPIDQIPGRPDRTAMCQALERNLNQLCGQSMNCGLKVSPNHPEFSLPAWETLDIGENMQLLETMFRGEALQRERANPGWTDRTWKNVVARLLDPENSARLAVAEIDIMNRGKPESVYELRLGACDASADSPAIPSKILLARDAEAMTNPDWRAAGERGQDPYVGSAALGTSADIFFYDETTFLFHPGIEPWVDQMRTGVGGDGREIAGRITACDFDHKNESEQQ